MRGKMCLALILVAALLPACQQSPAAESKNITPETIVTPAPAVTPEPTPEPVSSETWQEAYIELLNGYESRRAGFPLDIQGIYEESYTLYDIDKDGLPELFLIEGLSEASRTCHVYFWQDGFAIEAGGHQEGYIEGPLDFWYGSLSTWPGENGVLWSRGYGYNKVSLVDGDLVGGSLEGTLPKDLSTDEITAELFAPDTEWLCYYEPSDIQPILDYGLLLAPWQAAYRDVLLHPEEYEEFYTVAEHIPSDQYERREIPTKIEHYCFAVCDVNGDGTQELLLKGDHLFLNILRYHEETGTVEDMDGPRTYPLMDTLFFYDTGYFGTINGAGGLYTEYWHLEEEDPDRYWYGYQRPYDSDYDGPRTTEIISFYSSDGEEFTLREYYERMGESGVSPSWQEITEDAVLQTLLAADGKEART